MAGLVGQILGGYRIEAYIGRGATGTVYRGTHVRRARRAAIKVLDASVATGPGFPARFLTIMQEVSALSHAHIIDVYDFGEQGGQFFIAMELVTGGSVRTYLRSQPPGQPLPLPFVVELVCQAAEGLAYAHVRGTLHKDVKPSNLLLQHVGAASAAEHESVELKITDFGLARLAEGASELTSTGVLLGTGILMGTPAYMSPEQCRGKKLDERSDLYALGLVLYEMMTGYLPFQATSLRDAVREHLYTAPPLPRMLAPDIPASVEQIVLRCLAKRPEDRYDTVTDLARALEMAVSLTSG